MIAEELEILKIAVSRLESAGIEYIVSGSIAGNFYSQPRMTRDIDVVIELPVGKIDEMYNLFKDDFYVDRDSIVEALKNRRMFNIIHNEKIIKIDFIIAQDNEFEKSKFAHRIRKEIDGVKVYVISPEDLILSKLLWSKDSRSQMQFNDVRNILFFNKTKLNINYLIDQAEKLGVKKNLEECLNAL